MKQKNQEGILLTEDPDTGFIEYKHPIFSHTEDGDIHKLIRPKPDLDSAWTTFDFDLVLKYESYEGYTLKKPLTDDIINDHFIKVMDEFKTIQDFNYFLGGHFHLYYALLKANQSEQPFFTYLINLVSSKKGDIFKTKYDLFRQWIVEHPNYREIDISSKENYHSSLSGLDEKIYSKLTNLFSLEGASSKRIALFCSYENIVINSENSAAIAKCFGFVSKTSGIQLERKYDNVSTEKKRIAVDGDMVHYRTKDIKAIISFLSPTMQETAKNDLRKLEDKLLTIS